MSFRKQKFDNEFMPLWIDIKEMALNIDARGISTADRDEIAQLKKVIAYFSEMLNSLDPDFIPLQVLNSIHNPLSNIRSLLQSYISSKNIQYIVNINNDYLDTLLRDLMPFIFYKGKASKALQNALSEYSETILTHTDSFVDKSKNALENILDSKNIIDNIKNNLDTTKDQIDQYRFKLFEQDDNIEDKINSLISEIEDKSDQVSVLYNNIFQENGIKYQIESSREEVKQVVEDIYEIRDKTSDFIKKLENFYDKVYGIKDSDGNFNGGLKQEIQERQSELEEFKKMQQIRYHELNIQIESLLPAATSVGLASAYKDMKDDCSKNIKIYNGIFYFSLFSLFLTVLIMQYLGFSNVWTSNDNLGNNLIGLLKVFSIKLPFIIPTLWLAMFSSKRRNESQRLEQEYAHKEALAKSYASYRQQIENLGDEKQQELLPILLESMIKSIAFNPAETLDKNHKDDTPIDTINKLEILAKKEPFKTVLEKIIHNSK
jgi:hypothetical protein